MKKKIWDLFREIIRKSDDIEDKTETFSKTKLGRAAGITLFILIAAAFAVIIYFVAK